MCQPHMIVALNEIIHSFHKFLGTYYVPDVREQDRFPALLPFTRIKE